MKFSQIAAVVVTLLISMGVVMWLAKSVPSAVLDDSSRSEQSEETPEEAPPPLETDVHTENPFSVAKSGPQPKAVLPETLHTFDAMALGQTGHHDFVIKNEGESPLKLAKGPVQCKCTVNGLKEETVLPGEEASIHLEWTPKSIGQFGQGAVIWTNDPESPKLEIRVEGMMVPEVEIVPTNGWSLGTVPSGKASPLKGYISTGLYDTFEITDVETSTPNLKIEFIPMNAGELDLHHAKVGYNLVGEYLPPEESGTFSEKVKIKTTLNEHAEFVFNVTGSRSGPVAIIGPGWTASTRTLDLGRVSAEKGKKHRLTLMVEPAENPLEVSEIVANPAFLKTEFRAEENSASASRERYTLFIEVPESSPKGIWTSQEPGELIIKTNHPKLGEISINLQMFIQ